MSDVLIVDDYRSPIRTGGKGREMDNLSCRAGRMTVASTAVVDNSDQSVLDLLARNGSSVPMPGAELQIRSLMLHLDQRSRARTLVVEFPPGFTRNESGYYPCGEEVLVLAGRLHVAGLILGLGDWAWLPPGMLRRGLQSEDGATVYAWFSGRNDWNPSEEGQSNFSARRVQLGLSAATPGPLRGGKNGDAQGASAVERPGAHIAGPAEILNLERLTWRMVDNCDTAVAGPGPSLVRMPGSGGIDGTEIE